MSYPQRIQAFSTGLIQLATRVVLFKAVGQSAPPIPFRLFARSIFLRFVHCCHRIHLPSRHRSARGRFEIDAPNYSNGRSGKTSLSCSSRFAESHRFKECAGCIFPEEKSAQALLRRSSFTVVRIPVEVGQ